MTDYEIRLCQNPACGLRYPLPEEHPFGLRCPLCLGETSPILRRALSAEPEPAAAPPARQVCALLDNIRSAWNVGAMFRTADGLGVRKMYLSGITPLPQNAKVQKTSLGAEKNIPWQYASNAILLAQELKAQGAWLIGLEQDARAEDISAASPPPHLPIVLVVGNELTGVDPGLLTLCDQVWQIPMRGRKRSLNVEVAFALGAYALLSG
jgi:tRNA G18 (ribose-2'-O)-methylase SpoU